MFYTDGGDRGSNDEKKNLRDGNNNKSGNDGLGTSKTKPFDSTEIIPLQNAHSYKDNLRSRPLFDALENGFCSFGIDIKYDIKHKELYTANPNVQDNVFEDKYKLRNLYLKPITDFINSKDRPIVFDKSVTLGICKQISLFITLDPDYQEQSWLALETMLHDRAYTIKSTDSPIFHEYDFINGGSNTVNYGTDQDKNDKMRMKEDEPFLSPARIIVSGIDNMNTFSNFVVSKLQENKFSRMTSVEGSGSDVLQWDKDTNPNTLRIQQYAGEMYRSFFQWPGMRGHMEVRAQIRDYKKRMMEYNLPIRLQDSPDDVELWDIMVEEGTDVISTQDIEKLKEYLFSYKSKKLPM